MHAPPRIEFASAAISGSVCSSTHPAHWTDELIQTIAECKKVARYIDIPLQHIHENMLERMRRETSQQYIVGFNQTYPRWRAGHRDSGQRSSWGFPGETEASFKALLDFIRETKFSRRLGVFAYSKEDGTRAGAMAGQLSDKLKQKRRELAMQAQHTVAIAVSERSVRRSRNQGAHSKHKRTQNNFNAQMSVLGSTVSSAKQTSIQAR